MLPAGADAPESVPVVVWISVDGLRGDYISRYDLPFFQRVLSEGAYSQQLSPIFPTLTFPSHIAEATGALVCQHGIIANALYDLANDHPWPYPNENSVILCEPIWNTAQRQGRRTAVYDWPVSQKQAGENAAAYFNQFYDTDLKDEVRLEHLWSTWDRDQDAEPLRLLMGYFPGVDSAGHKYGPNSPQVKAALERADELLAKSFQRCEEIIDSKYPVGTEWYFIVSTDHGMDEIHSLVSLKGILADAYSDDVRSCTSGSVANIFLQFVAGDDARQARGEFILEKLKRYEFIHAYRRKNLPKEWGYDCPGRSGDIVVSLDPGYFFSEGEGPPIRPVDPERGPLGMHGYPLAECPAMNGFLGIWRSGKPLGGNDLGTIDCRRLHSTVAHLLKIEPAPTALDEPIPGL
jgi:Type I phosphodiesterase / nucleotide pyrophosphatase